ncbi:MAG: hypothetical protein KC646_01115 [Candidatus Cloacimonetes bacterium]|nr:hypothetical protein [Candidatus Cloacimonadota bacterium]
MKKIALIGNGKTGSKVAELSKDYEVVVFDSKNKVSVERLLLCDVAIVFVSGDVFVSIIPILLDSKIPVVSGSTGFDLPDDLEANIIASQSKWVLAANFSLVMNVVQSILESLNGFSDLFENSNYSIHEVHHTKKLDAPSGTALKWQDWVSQDCEISSAREGDVIGFHELKVETPYETLKISHDAQDRALFASGAIWAANQLLKKRQPGLYEFRDLVLEGMR